MPNHITSIITLNGSEKRIEELKENIKSKESIFDFNKIIPMPKDLDINIYKVNFTNFVFYNKDLSVIEFAKKFREECKADFNERFEKAALQGIINYLKYGYVSWYSWSIDNWGTKWNSYEAEYLSGNKITFQTAWEFPKPIIQKLSELYPELTIIAEYYAEDFGYHLGSCTFKEGILIDGGALEDDSQEGYALLWEICPYAEDYLEKIDGKFIRKYE